MQVKYNDILMNDSLKFGLAVPQTKVECLGTIDGENKKFNVPEPPVHTVTGRVFNPSIADINVWTRKTATQVVTDTPITPSKLNATLNAEAEAEIYQEIEFTTAPAAADVDNVVASYWEEMIPFVQQDVTPSIKQKTVDVGEMGSVRNLRGYGTMTIGIKSEQTMAKETWLYLSKLMWGTYQGTEEEVVGYDTKTLLSKPLDLKGFLLMDYGDEELAKVYLNGLTITPDLPGGKQGSEVKVTIDTNISELPNLVLPTPAL